MGFRFRRSIRILPGVRLNFSRSGVSASLGGRGATVNVGKRGVRATVGIPGTGLSYSERLDRPARVGDDMPQGEPPAARPISRGARWLVALLVAFAAGMLVASVMR